MRRLQEGHKVPLEEEKDKAARDEVQGVLFEARRVHQDVRRLADPCLQRTERRAKD